MIIVENGSTDDGLEIARSFTDQRIKPIVAPKSVRGPGAARNLGLESCSGQWVLFLDADDLIEPTSLERRAECILASEPTATVVAGDWSEFTDSSEKPTVHSPIGKTDGLEILSDCSFAFAPWALHAAVVRRDHLISNHWILSADKYAGEDTAFWFQVLCPLLNRQNRLDLIRYVDHSGALYRRHSQFSRDDELKNLMSRFNSAQSNLNLNLNTAAKNQVQVSENQFANAFRMLRAICREAKSSPSFDPGTFKSFQMEARKWLRGTRLLNPRMLYWRMRLGEFRSFATEFRQPKNSLPSLNS